MVLHCIVHAVYNMVWANGILIAVLLTSSNLQGSHFYIFRYSKVYFTENNMKGVDGFETCQVNATVNESLHVCLKLRKK